MPPGARRTTPYHLLAEAVEELQVRSILKARHPRASERALANVEVVLEMARAYAGRGIGDFARALWQQWNDADRQAEGRPDAQADAVSIITIHSGAAARAAGTSTQTAGARLNEQDAATWRREATEIAANQQRISWHQPSRHEGSDAPGEEPEAVFTGTAELLESITGVAGEIGTQGSAERGLILHKLMEQILTGEVKEDLESLRVRAAELIAQLGQEDSPDASTGLYSAEMAATAVATLELPEVAALQPRLLPEFWVYAHESGESEPESEPGIEPGIEPGSEPEQPSHRPPVATDSMAPKTPAISTLALTAGIADAVAIDDGGGIDVVVDWKSDVDPGPGRRAEYRSQVRDYLRATGAREGLIVYMTRGWIDRVVKR